MEKPNFFRSYLLIHPDTSRTYDFWQVIVLLSYLTEFCLMPYTVCTDV